MRPYRIALDANEANVASRVGSNVYAYQLLLQLEKRTRESPEFSFTIYLSSPRQSDFPPERLGWKYKVLTPRSLWTQWRFPLELLLHFRSFDLVLSLGHYAPRFSPIPTVICIMDLAFLHFPQFFRQKDLMQLTNWTRYGAKAAKHIITISQNSKLDVLKEYGRAPEEISVIYPGVETKTNLDETKEKEVLDRFQLADKKYLVCVGTIQPRKNHINLIKAFEKLKEEHVKLVLIGKVGWLSSEFEETVAMSPAKERIVVTGFVDEATKYTLLKYSHGNILVGFYEGFGIPPLEGMSVGVVPVVSNVASLPEVVGDLGILVDPYSIDDIARGLREVLSKEVTSSLKQQLKQQAAKFSWDKSGQKLIEVLRDLQ